ncbi:MAG: hypothetical protein JOY82_09535 [Streptosporangiaceae bacterium]|nr:hypothetical protein [Streptosporangiaceae bacterium]MBV9854754.1 hypothetical protein [Streptosporangiaceae bacterium]
MTAITWAKPAGAEFTAVDIGDGGLRASGIAVGGEPLPYHLAWVSVPGLVIDCPGLASCVSLS